MPIFSIFGLFFGVVLWAGVASLILKRLFRRANPRLLNTISVAVPVLMALPLGIDEYFFVTLLLTVPGWFLLEHFDRRERTAAPPGQKAGQTTPRNGAD